ncbi:ribonuclease H2 subunit C isoform X2 [Chelonia mydas]|uniref:ribonuclease H2 subunit C isoform X2 n=2 Tax=Chelonia mydas TaxID=8469 RepID=UPI001CA9A5BE|nr:ribonuclease H2 subunit C isoform X2 [Chelonia mydas]
MHRGGGLPPAECAGLRTTPPSMHRDRRAARCDGIPVGVIPFSGCARDARPQLSSACLWSKMSESSSPVRLDLSSLREAPQDVLHLLPCEVEHNGSAPVDRYFTPAIRQGSQEKSVSFRGRSLKGQEVMVPQGYVGLVLKEDQRPCTEEEERTVRLKSTFGALTVWNLERAPSADDGLLLALSWPGIAEAIHAPVLKKEQ